MPLGSFEPGRFFDALQIDPEAEAGAIRLCHDESPEPRSPRSFSTWRLGRISPPFGHPASRPRPLSLDRLPMSSLYGQLADWIALLLRWTHVIAGIAWIGSSFYFVALDPALKKDGPLDPGVGGESGRCMAAASIVSRNLRSRRAPGEGPDLVHVGGLQHLALRRRVDGLHLLPQPFALSRRSSGGVPEPGRSSGDLGVAHARHVADL